MLVYLVFGAWMMAGFLLLLVLERFMMVHACEEHGCDYHTVGLAAFVGQHPLWIVRPERAFGIIERPDEFSARATKWVW